MGGFYRPSEEEARSIGGSNLIVPNGEDAKAHDLRVREKVFGDGPAARKVNVHTWRELVSIDDLTLESQENGDSAMLRDHNGDPLPLERSVLQVRISQSVPSPNAGRVLFDYARIYWGLGKYSPKQLEEWEEEYAGTQDPRGRFQSLRGQSSMASRRWASLLKALGLQDKLASRQNFLGFGSIADIQGSFIGQQVNVIVSQGEDKDGVLRDNIQGYLQK